MCRHWFNVLFVTTSCSQDVLTNTRWDLFSPSCFKLMGLFAESCPVQKIVGWDHLLGMVQSVFEMVQGFATGTCSSVKTAQTTGCSPSGPKILGTADDHKDCRTRKFAGRRQIKTFRYRSQRVSGEQHSEIAPLGSSNQIYPALEITATPYRLWPLSLLVPDPVRPSRVDRSSWSLLRSLESVLNRSKCTYMRCIA